MNYLIVSIYHRLIDDFIKEKCFKDIDVIKMDLSTTTLSEIIEEAKYNSLFDPYKNIVIYNASFFGSQKADEKDIDNLLQYLSNPNPNTCLIFVYDDKVDYRKKVTKYFKDNKCIEDLVKLDYRTMCDYVNKYIKDNKWNINYDVVNYVIKASNNNYDIACNELDKMMLCYNHDPSLEEASKIVSNSMSDSIYKFVDAVIDKDSKNAIKLLNELKIYKVEASLILLSLVKSFRQMLFYKIAIKENVDPKFALKADNLQDWQIKKVSESSKKYSIEKLINTIHLLAEYDYKYKSGKLDKDVIINSFILEFIE
jgi:DNA polymerase-3 subunit delta